jgi:putative hydrolase of the HAD superfamily
MERRGRQALTLMLDADDTLWENNIYFLEVTEEFVREVMPFGVEPATARAALYETERKNIPAFGYGSRAFAVSVIEAFRLLAPSSNPEAERRLEDLALSIYRRDQLELRPGACETLSVLANHHRLVLVTKGDKEEQEWKVQCSGLRQHFEWVEVVPEKDVATYAALIRRLRAAPSRTWMIGNSPRSDINPALEAGLNAVLIPHPHTWELEVEELDRHHERLIIVDSLQDVIPLFVPEVHRTA